MEELEELDREQAESLPAPQTVSAPPATVFQGATNANVVSSMPYAPSGGLREESEEEAAIRALQASMM